MGKYKTNPGMPPIDRKLLNTQDLYVMDKGDRDGTGHQFVQFKVTKVKAQKHNDAAGVARTGSFKFTLQNSRGKLVKVRLLESDYGTNGKWYRSKKVRYQW